MVALLNETEDERGAAYAGEVAARIERLPLSAWQVKTRIIVGTATFFDAFDALSIAYILPVIVRCGKFRRKKVGSAHLGGISRTAVRRAVLRLVRERFGRMKALFSRLRRSGLLSFACAFAWDYASLLMLRTLQGFGLGGEVPVAATYIGELAKARAAVVSCCCSSGVSERHSRGLPARLWLVPSFGWQSIFVIGAIPSGAGAVPAAAVAGIAALAAARGRYAEAEAALRVVEAGTEKALGRKLPPPQAALIMRAKAPSWSDLFGPLYLRRTLVVWVMWFATYFINYGLATWMPTLYRTIFHLPLDVALRYQLITNVVTLCSSFACAMLIDLTGRRRWFVAAFFCSALALLALWYIGPTTAGRVLLLGTLSNMCVGTMSLAVYLYTPELYPTRSRALGVGTATAWLRLASIIGPNIVGFLVADGGLGSVFLVFGLVGISASGIVALFAIETKGQVLEEISP
jgi:putative MFS transporter